MFSSTVQKPNSPGATFLGPECVSVIWDALPLGGLGRLSVSDCESLRCHKAHTTTAITTDLLPLCSYLNRMSHTQQQHCRVACKSHLSFYLESHLSFLGPRPMKRNGAQKLWHRSIKKMQIQCLAVWILLMTKDNLFIIKGDWFVAPSLLFHLLVMVQNWTQEFWTHLIQIPILVLSWFSVCALLSTLGPEEATEYGSGSHSLCFPCWRWL